MKAKALIIAIAVAGIGVGLMYIYMRRFEQEVSGGAPVSILVAKQDIPLGEQLTEDMVGIGQIPTAYLTGRHVPAEALNRVIGVRVRTQVRAAESILWTDLATTNEHSRDLSSLIADGMRAVTIGTSGGAFGGLLRPGDRVDILLTVSGEGIAPRTLSLLQNLMVLAVGQNTSNGGDDFDSQTSVTFSVTVEQSQLLTFSSTLGSMSLTLRNADDITVIEDVPETTVSDVVEQLRRINIQTRQARPRSRPSVPSGPQKLN